MAQEVKKGNFLDHLTKGLYDAVVQAQALAENQHIEALSKYINEDGTPKCMKMVINGEDINVPLITLAPQSSGAIDADLGSSILPTRNNYANLTITFEGSEPPEGLVRLNNNLIKQIP
jgi:hypothetical protein